MTAVIAGVVVIQILPLTLALALGQLNGMAIHALNLPIIAGLLLAVWQGRDWARVLLVFLLGMSALLLFLAGAALERLLAGFAWLLALPYVAAIGVLTLSAAAKAFLLDQRRAREGDPSLRRRV